MIFGKMPAAVIAGALLSCMGLNLASAELPGDTRSYPGRVYTLHTKAVANCPSLDWHIVVGENSTLSGMIATDNMAAVFKVSGKFNPLDRSFRLDGTEVSGPHPGTPGAVNGQVQSDGRLAATLGGLPMGAACQGKTVYLRWLSPAPGEGGEGG